MEASHLAAGSHKASERRVREERNLKHCWGVEKHTWVVPAFERKEKRKEKEVARF